MRTPKTIGRIVVLTALSAVCLYAQPTPRHPGVAWEDLPLLRTGVKIRAASSCNPTAFHQEVQVAVNGTAAGIWFKRGSQYRVFREESLGLPPRPGYDPDWRSINKRYRDTEFELPASLTRGKSSLTLTLTTLGSHSALEGADEGLTNEYYYWVYSYKRIPGD